MKEETKEFLKKLKYVALVPGVLLIAMMVVSCIMMGTCTQCVEAGINTGDTVITYMSGWASIFSVWAFWISVIVSLGIFLILCHLNINEYYIRFGDEKKE